MPAPCFCPSLLVLNVCLQVSRCIGDFDYKSHGLTAEPEVTHTRLTPTDGVLVLGSDGLWDCISNEEAVSAAS